MNILGIFVKHPRPGSVKTRLAKGMGSQKAAELCAAFVADLADRFRRTSDKRVLCYSPPGPDTLSYFEGIAGDAYALWEQPQTLFGDRLEAFFREHIVSAVDRVVLIGSDSPTLPSDYIERAFRLLADNDCVIGPATDGGFYLIGQQGRSWPVFAGVDWSCSRVLEQTTARISACGARLALLNPWYDVDTPDDWQMLRGHLRGMELAGIACEMPRTKRLLIQDTHFPTGSL